MQAVLFLEAAVLVLVEAVVPLKLVKTVVLEITLVTVVMALRLLLLARP
jgi:hypothetical protein